MKEIYLSADDYVLALIGSPEKDFLRMLEEFEKERQ